MEKLTVVINGRGGVGKDTLCDILAKNYRVLAVSAITPIKEIASKYGWEGQKDIKSRKFLSDLKRVFIDYNNLPNNYLVNEHKKFLEDNNQLMLVHIRENDQIELFKKSINGKCITLLIRRNIKDTMIYGNYSDDNVDIYDYDYYFDNDDSLIIAEKKFLEFFKNVLLNENVG